MLHAYLSHPIRGAKGSDATQADMEANNQRAIEFAARVRDEFPGIILYVPAEHDEFVLLAYGNGYLKESQILAIDKLILARRDILIVYAPTGYIGGGVGEEIGEAQCLGKPLCITNGALDPIHRLLESMAQ
jgi:hypothetical protein